MKKTIEYVFPNQSVHSFFEKFHSHVNINIYTPQRTTPNTATRHRKDRRRRHWTDRPASSLRSPNSAPRHVPRVMSFQKLGMLDALGSDRGVAREARRASVAAARAPGIAYLFPWPTEAASARRARSSPWRVAGAHLVGSAGALLTGCSSRPRSDRVPAGREALIARAPDRGNPVSVLT